MFYVRSIGRGRIRILIFFKNLHIMSVIMHACMHMRRLQSMCMHIITYIRMYAAACIQHAYERGQQI
jgi:hypothetical protein